MKNKKEISDLNQNLKSFHKLMKEKLKFSNKSQNQKMNIDNTNNELSFIKENDILTEISKFAYCYPESRLLTIEYLSSFLNSNKPIIKPPISRYLLSL